MNASGTVLIAAPNGSAFTVNAELTGHAKPSRSAPSTKSYHGKRSSRVRSNG